MLLQNNSEGNEQLIAFFSRALREAELNYNIIEKQAYTMVQSLKDFRIYVLHSHVVAYVPEAAVKEILTQHDVDGRRGKWISIMLEYDLEIMPTKLIKGNGLAKMMTHSNYDVLVSFKFQI